MKKQLLLLSFFEGATVMVAELCGARLLAPVFGSSLYVWASVMGITLFALAAGYFWGGWLSKGPDRDKIVLFRILVLAAVSVLAMPLLTTLTLPYFAALPFRIAVVVSSFVVLVPPITFLGAASPLFISLQTNTTHSAGKVSGLVYAVSTLGGILATFISGFYLIPELGMNLTLLLFGCLLLISTFVLIKKLDIYSACFAAGVLLLFTGFKQDVTGLIYESEGLMGTVRVLEEERDKSKIRFLSVNNIIQSEMNIQTGKSVSRYVMMLDSIIAPVPIGSKALVLGLGAGLTANLLVEKGFSVDALEFDERVIDCANLYFGLLPEVSVFHEDARHYINRCETKYDLILVDVFKAEEQPSHVITSESLERFKHCLLPGSAIFINWHGYLNEELGEGSAVLLNTLYQSGFTVKACSFSLNEHHRNLIFIAGLAELKEYPFEIGLSRVTNNKVNTDNRPVFEKANAKANRSWRALYLKASGIRK